MATKSALQTVFSTFRFRPPTEEDLDRRLWSTLWFQPVLADVHLPSEAEACALALERWRESDHAEPYLIGYEIAPDALGVDREGWHVFRLDLATTAQLPAIDEGGLPVLVRELDAGPFTSWEDAVWEAERFWRKERGRRALVLRTEILEKTEITRRRLKRRGY